MSQFNKAIGRKFAGDVRSLPVLGIVATIDSSISLGGARFCTTLLKATTRWVRSTCENDL